MLDLFFMKRVYTVPIFTQPSVQKARSIEQRRCGASIANDHACSLPISVR